MNHVILIGNLTKDPELRYTQSQTAVCRFTVAVNDRAKNPNSGEWEDTPSFIPVIVWGRLAENCDKFLSKGRKVAVNGRIKTGSYTNKEGRKVYTTDVVASNVEFLSHETPQTPREDWPPREQVQTNQAYAQRDQGEQISYQQYQQEKRQVPPGFEDVEQDVPF